MGLNKNSFLASVALLMIAACADHRVHVGSSAPQPTTAQAPSAQPAASTPNPRLGDMRHVNPPPPVPQGQTPTKESEQLRLQRLFPLLAIRCANPNECPKSIGAVIKITPITGTTQVETYRCTGIMVAPDIVLTAGHCLPQVNQEQQFCRDNIAFRIVADQGQGVTSFCSEILYNGFIKPTESNPYRGHDIALMRLQRSLVSETFVERLANSGFKDRAPIQAFALDSDGATHKFVINKKKCTVGLGSIWMDFSKSEMADTVYTYGAKCKSVGGNSGAAAFNSDGKIVGVMSIGDARDAAEKPNAAKEDPEAKAAVEYFNKLVFGDLLRKLTRNWGAFANLACVKLETLAHEARTGCENQKHGEQARTHEWAEFIQVQRVAELSVRARIAHPELNQFDQSLHAFGRFFPFGASDSHKVTGATKDSIFNTDTQFEMIPFCLHVPATTSFQKIDFYSGPLHRVKMGIGLTPEGFPQAFIREVKVLNKMKLYQATYQQSAMYYDPVSFTDLESAQAPRLLQWYQQRGLFQVASSPAVIGKIPTCR